MVILFRPDSEHSRSVNDYVRELYARDPEIEIEAVDVDSESGNQTAELYDIQSYPAIMVVQNDGSVSKLWQDEQLPLIDEVISYLIA